MAGSVWAYDRASFVSRRKAYGGKIVLYETHSKTMDIDTMEDFVEVSALIQEANCVIM
jgi:CMP-N-acetylneuraminic acid synthetase